jgi:hypothetical protein
MLYAAMLDKFLGDSLHDSIEPWTGYLEKQNRFTTPAADRLFAGGMCAKPVQISGGYVNGWKKCVNLIRFQLARNMRESPVTPAGDRTLWSYLRAAR